jgi:dihydropteroate synthase
MKTVTFKHQGDIEEKFEEIGVDPNARSIMAGKFQFHIVEIPEVTNIEANILKQKMLVLGGEAAIHRHSISCSIPTTKVLLAGTRKTFTSLIERIRHEVGALPALATDLHKLLFSSE